MTESGLQLPNHSLGKVLREGVVYSSVLSLGCLPVMGYYLPFRWSSLSVNPDICDIMQSAHPVARVKIVFLLSFLLLILSAEDIPLRDEKVFVEPLSEWDVL